MADNIFERLKKNLTQTTGDSTTEAAGTPEKLTRYIGGSERNNHPFVTGYWQFFIFPPEKIFTDAATAKEAGKWMHSTAEGFTPPSRTLNKADVPGQGGLGASFVTGQTLNRTFTVTFREYRNVPILTATELWCSVIDPYMGVSPLKGDEWLPKNYKGTAVAILTRPVQADGDGAATESDIEQIFYFDGVFPEAPPYETFASDISGNDLLQHSITFSFDGWPLTRVDKAAMDKAMDLLNFSRYKETYDSYAVNFGGPTSGSAAGM